MGVILLVDHRGANMFLFARKIFGVGLNCKILLTAIYSISGYVLKKRCKESHTLQAA